MSLKLLIAAPVFLVFVNAAGAAEQTRQTTVVQDMATGPAAGGNKIKNPAGGTNLPAVQKLREAANRTPQADKHRGEIEVQSLSLGAVNGAAGQRTHHAGGANILLGDGSVRQGGSSVGSNETITIGSGSTETKPGSGNDSVWMDLGTPVGRAPDGMPKGGSLGSLQGMGSINQLAAPQGTGDAAGREVRHRSFAIVDRTQMSKDGANTGAAGGNKTQTIGIGRTETTAGGGPHVKAFSGNGGAGAARPSSNITMKGSTIRQN
ncbi:MAG: hypothetical protein JNM30_12660 [Rhodospirillales bacterium]|nr:hypothetical protein [Rhodospirillales bacterium]